MGKSLKMQALSQFSGDFQKQSRSLYLFKHVLQTLRLRVWQQLACLQLCSLAISHCFEVTDKGVAKLAAGYPQLFFPDCETNR